MHKNKYLKELKISKTQKKGGSNSRKEVAKIQSWLCLHAHMNSGTGTMTGIDGDFGPATQRAVKNFQKAKRISETGEVSQTVFDKLSAPMKNAYEYDTKKSTLRKTIVAVAEQHLKQNARELTINGQSNSGPWVRAYMDGHEGTPWFWCMGFVQAIIDQAFTIHGQSFKEMMPLTYSCDVVGMKGIEHGCLMRYLTVRTSPQDVKPGDIVLVRKTKYDWTHTAIVTEVHGSTFTTIEGNTNLAGSRNGLGVFKRIRNFRNSKLEIFSIKKWVMDLDFELKTVRLKSRGDVVRFLEEKLVEIGYHNVIVSNYFGNSTYDAVLDFQRKNNLFDDGIVGPKTWTVLLG